MLGAGPVCGPCVGSNKNKNVTDNQNELILWSCNIGISMYNNQELMKEQSMKDTNGNKVVLPPIIFPKFKSTSKCPVPACTS